MRACLLGLGLLLFACNSAPYVIPFPDAGDPCAAGSHINCGQYPETTCTSPVDAGCATMTYGCADAAYFADVDTSRCTEGGLFGDASLIHGTEGGRD